MAVEIVKLRPPKGWGPALSRYVPVNGGNPVAVGFEEAIKMANKIISERGYDPTSQRFGVCIDPVTGHWNYTSELVGVSVKLYIL